MEIKQRKLKKGYSNNRFGNGYGPLKTDTSTFYFHEKGIVGVGFIDDVFGNKIILEFVKNKISYSTRIKKFKSERSLALLISKFHLAIELL